MNKKTQVLIRNEHVATKKENPNDYGLGSSEYAKFCADIESCRNDKGRWDYDKFVALAHKLVSWKADAPETWVPEPESTNKPNYDFSHFVKTEDEINTYLEEHDPLSINPWIKDDKKKKP